MADFNLTTKARISFLTGILEANIDDEVLTLTDIDVATELNRQIKEATYDEYFDVYDDTTNTINLKHWPVNSSETVTIQNDAQADSPTTLDTDDYNLFDDIGVLEYVGYFTKGKQTVRAQYTAGYASDSVDPDFLKIKQLAGYLGARIAVQNYHPNSAIAQGPVKSETLGNYSVSFQVPAEDTWDKQIEALLGSIGVEVHMDVIGELGTP